MVVLIGADFHVACDGVVMMIHGESVSTRCDKSVKCMVESCCGDLFFMECCCYFVEARLA